MADVPGKFYRATKVRTGVSPSSAGSIEGEPLPPVNPPGSSLNSVGLTMPSAFTVSNSPLTANGTIGVAGAGTVSQYIRGDGSLADFPEASGGGGSVNYYLNGSVDQGTIGGVAYKEINKVPILGAGTQFSISADGYIASFLTDAGDPNLLEIPGGNWNFETYFSSSSSGGTPTFYVELYKYDGTTFTLIASSVTSPEFIAFGTTLTPYFSTLAVPTTALALTDRLAIRYYVTHSGRTITLHTENNTLCQIITTFTTGLTALNGLTAQVQNFAVGTTGTDFNIASAVSTHTFNLPTASATNRGALSTSDWSMFNAKQNALTLTTTGTSGAATLVGATLNIPNYGSALSGYLPLIGGTMTGNINWAQTDRGLTWLFNTDGASIKFYNTGDGDTNSRLEFATLDNNNEYFRWVHIPDGGTLYESMRLVPNSSGNAQLIVSGSIIKQGGTSSQYLMADGSVSTLTNPVTGTGVSGRVAYWNGTNSITSDADLLFNGSELNVSGIKIDGSSVPYIVSTLAGNDLNIQFPVGQGLAINNNGAENIARIIKNNFSLIGASTIQTSTGNLTISTAGGNGNIILSPHGTGTTSITSSLTTKNASTSASVAQFSVMGAGEIVSTGSLAGFFWENRSGGVTSNSNWYGWYTSAGIIRLYNGSTDILEINGSSGAATFDSSITATSIIRSGGTSSQYLMADGSVSTLSNPITGTGTTNYLPKFTGSTTIGNSAITDDGTNLNLISRSLIIANSGFTAAYIGATSSQGFLNLYSGTSSGYNNGANITLVSSDRSGAFTRGEIYIEAGNASNNTASGFIQMLTGNSPRMTITYGGNVGIGTPSPANKLQVEGTINTTYSPLDTLNGGVVAYIKNASTTNSTDATIRLEATGSASLGAASISAVHTGNGSSDLTFGTRISSGNVTERMRITSGGNVGIGINAQARLQVFGGTGAYPTLGTNVANSLFISRNDGLLGTYFGYAADGNGWIQQMRNDSATAYNLVLQPVGGNVLIGTTTDNGARLQVNGTSTFSGTATFSLDIIVNGVNVGRGGGSITTNTRIGTSALASNTTGSSNTAVGFGSLQTNTTGTNNTAIGLYSLLANTTGVTNTAVGVSALTANTTGNGNSAFGLSALALNTTGTNNSALGLNALVSNTTGGTNTSLGFSSLGNNTTGSNNAALGSYAGSFVTGGGPNNTSSNSVYLGADSRGSASGNTNEIVIGYDARGEGSNTAVIGNTSITKTILRGSIGVGTTNATGQSADNRVIQIYGAGSANRAQIHFVNSDSGESTTDGSFIGIDFSRELYIINRENAATIFENNGAETFRITAGGKGLFGTQTASAGANGFAAKSFQVKDEIVSIGSTAGIFWENRSGGVTASSNWYGWYTTGGVIYLYNGASNIASINSSTGAYTALSDINKKENFETSEIGLKEVLNLKPTIYSIKDDTKKERHLGFIAQEVKQYIPQAYIENDGFIGLNEMPIIAALTKAIQELKQEIDTLKN
jgi:hypothetical protein